MPSSRGSNPAGADRDKLAEWEARAYTKLRAQRDARTPFDDALPEEPLDDLAATRSALSRLPSA